MRTSGFQPVLFMLETGGIEGGIVKKGFDIRVCVLVAWEAFGIDFIVGIEII